ncbi:MAG: AMP-binding protein [Microbacteriaceae bacterium]
MITEVTGSNVESLHLEDGILHMSRLLRKNATERPTRVALREKRYGIWQSITWQAYLDSVEKMAHGMLALGVTEEDRVAIQSENRSEWLFADVASTMIRAITVGVYPTNPVPEVEYLIRHSGAKILFAEDQEQVDKALQLVDKLPDLAWVVYLDSRGLAEYEHPKLISIDELLAKGEEHLAAHPGQLDDIESRRSDNDLVTLIYTSGTTGPPKGAMLSAENVSFGMRVFGADSGMFGDHAIGEDDVLLSYLPLSHVVERAITIWVNLYNRTVVHFAESIDTVTQDLAEVQPTALFGVPRIWEKIQAGISIKMAAASPLKRFIYHRVVKGSGRFADIVISHGGKYTTMDKLRYFVSWVLVYRPLRERIGLLKIRHALSGAAPISVDVLRYFVGMGVPLYEAYGMTENSAVATTNFVNRMKLGTVGEPQPGTEMRIDPETGELFTRSPGNFVGYWNNPEATAETLSHDNWLSTGDVAEFVDGTHIKIIDRMKDIIITAGGKNISPSEIENKLKSSPYIKEAVIIGDRRPYLTGLIGIEFDTVSDWASRKGIEYTTYRDLATKPEVVALITEVVSESNEYFARVERIRKFRMLVKELDHEDGELTATQKLKRQAFAATVPELIEDMYQGKEEHAGSDLGENNGGLTGNIYLPAASEAKR